MLGNFSIGDYFKEEAIPFAWEFLTSEEWMGIDKDKLYVSVYTDDDQAYKIWTEVCKVDPSHILKTYDNFWEIGKGQVDQTQKSSLTAVKNMIQKVLEKNCSLKKWKMIVMLKFGTLYSHNMIVIQSWIVKIIKNYLKKYRYRNGSRKTRCLDPGWGNKL